MDMFEKAARRKLRFGTPTGSLIVEDLFDLPLTTVRPGRASLDDLARSLNKQVKAAGEESFVEDKSAADEDLTLAFDIVKHVIAVKKAEAKDAKEALEKREKKQKLMALIVEKRDSALRDMPLEELEKQLEAL